MLYDSKSDYLRQKSDLDDNEIQYRAYVLSMTLQTTRKHNICIFFYGTINNECLSKDKIKVLWCQKIISAFITNLEMYFLLYPCKW